MQPHPEIAPWFIGTWIALGAVGLGSTYFDKNIARKKRLLPVFTIATGATFLLFTLFMMPSAKVMAFAVPAVVLITWLNLRMVRFCSACGRTIQSGMWLSRAAYCPKCGARLD